MLLLITAITLFLFAFYKWVTLNYDYFENGNIKYLEPTFFLGTTGAQLFNQYTPPEFVQKVYKAFPNEPVCGMFGFRRPQCIIRDPEILKRIAIKSFDHFADHEGFVDEKIDTLWGNMLFFLKSEKWRQMRATLSPAFTGSKVRLMFELVGECADDVVNHFLKEAANGQAVYVEMKDFFNRYASDIISTCGFGLKVNSFAEPHNEFYENGKKLMDLTSFKQVVKIILFLVAPSISKALKISIADEKLAKAFKDTILDTIEYRKKNNIYRPDMINMIMEIRKGTLKHQAEERERNQGFSTVEESEVGKATVNRNWSDDEMFAQCFGFFAGGSDTMSTVLMFAAYELAANPDIQQKLYEKIMETHEQLGRKRITYDALQKMKYLDQFISEVLRRWPPLPNLERACVKNYVYDEKFKFQVEKGTNIFIPAYGLHHDPKYFPEPEKFLPERFSDENKGNIIAGTYIPFGIGGRNCIGSRFALMVQKSAIYNLLLNFTFEPNEKTQIPLKLQKTSFSLVPENGVHLELKPRKK